MATITVLIAGRDGKSRAACLRSLRHERGIRVVGEARSGLDILAVAKLRPQILLLDLDLAPGGSIALLRVVRQQSRRTKVILLTHRVSDTVILDALSEGARGYLERRARRTFLAKAVRKVDAGEAWVPRRIVAKIIERLARLATRPSRRQ